MLNRAVLTGRLTRDPELRYTTSGTAVASFRIAVDRQFRNQQTGERDADFIDCVIWRKAAENFCNFTHKGSLVGIDGRLQSRNYENQQGQRVYVTEVVVDNFALLESRRNNGSQMGNQFGANQPGQNQGQPYANNGNQNNGYQSQNNGPAQNAPQNGNNNPQKPAGPSSNGNNDDPFQDNGKPVDISDDDLPF